MLMLLNASNYTKLCTLFLASLLISSFKFCTLVGKSFAYFSGILFVAPLLGAFFSSPVAIVLTGLLIATKALLFCYPITGGIPTLFATLAWSTHANISEQKSGYAHLFYFLVHAALPALCMAIFMTHASVGQGYVYAFYWLIPITLYFLHQIFKINSTFSVALSSTFIAHAIGSTLWLFTTPMKPEQWIALMPIVALERLVTALGMTILFLSAKKVFSYVQAKKKTAQSSISINNL